MNARAPTFDGEPVAGNREQTVSSPSRFNLDGIINSLQSIATVSEALRILGAAVILASMSVFMLQGWSDGNDIRRYLLLLTQTGLLTAAGFVLSHLVKETKGARLFFGLALMSIPANFTILGALLYSVVQWDGGLITYPGYADWRIKDLASVGATMGGAMLMLVPVTLFSFAVMARRSATSLSCHFLLLNSLLLLPIRSSIAAGTIALIGVVYALYVVSQLTRQNLSLNTGEGKFALAILFVPLGIILFRSMYFYQVDSLMIAMISLALFLSARQAAEFPDRNPNLAFLLELASWPLALIIPLALIVALDPGLASALKAPVFSVIYAALAGDVIRRTKSPMLGQAIAVSIGAAVAVSFTGAVMLSPSATTALFSIAAGIFLVLWGAAGNKVLTISAGVITLGAGALLGFDDIVNLIVASSWIDLAIFGATAIALGSVLDRHGVAAKLRLEHWYGHINKDKDAIATER